MNKISETKVKLEEIPLEIKMPWYAIILATLFSFFALAMIASFWGVFSDLFISPLGIPFLKPCLSIVVMYWIYKVIRKIWTAQGGVTTVCVLAILQWLGYGLDFPSAKFGRILLETSFIPIVVLAVGILMAKMPGIKAWADYRRRVQEFKEKYPDVDLKALGRMTPKSEATKSR